VEAPSVHFCGGVEERKGCGSDAAAVLPHAVTPVVAHNVHWCGGAPSAYCCGGVDVHKGGDGEEKKDGDAAAALPHAVAPVRAPSAYCCGGAEEQKMMQRRRGCYVCARGGSRVSAKRGDAGLHNERRLGNGLGNTSKNLRRTTRGAAGRSPGTTVK
jgi:hypothetical protein